MRGVWRTRRVRVDARQLVAWMDASSDARCPLHADALLSRVKSLRRGSSKATAVRNAAPARRCLLLLADLITRVRRRAAERGAVWGDGAWGRGQGGRDVWLPVHETGWGTRSKDEGASSASSLHYNRSASSARKHRARGRASARGAGAMRVMRRRRAVCAGCRVWRARRCAGFVRCVSCHRQRVARFIPCALAKRPAELEGVELEVALLAACIRGAGVALVAGGELRVACASCWHRAAYRCIVVGRSPPHQFYRRC